MLTEAGPCESTRLLLSNTSLHKLHIIAKHPWEKQHDRGWQFNLADLPEPSEVARLAESQICTRTMDYRKDAFIVFIIADVRFFVFFASAYPMTQSCASTQEELPIEELSCIA